MEIQFSDLFLSDLLSGIAMWDKCDSRISIYVVLSCTNRMPSASHTVLKRLVLLEVLCQGGMKKVKWFFQGYINQMLQGEKFQIGIRWLALSKLKACILGSSYICMMKYDHIYSSFLLFSKITTREPLWAIHCSMGILPLAISPMKSDCPCPSQYLILF